MKIWAAQMAGAPVASALAALGAPASLSFTLLRAGTRDGADLYANAALLWAAQGGPPAMEGARRLAAALSADDRVDGCFVREPGFVYFRLGDSLMAALWARQAGWTQGPWRGLAVPPEHRLYPLRSLLFRLQALEALEAWSPGPLPAGSAGVRRLFWRMQSAGTPAEAERAAADFEECFRAGEAVACLCRGVEGWLGPWLLARWEKERDV